MVVLERPYLVIVEHDPDIAYAMTGELRLRGVDVLSVHASAERAKLSAHWNEATACYFDHKASDECYDLLTWLKSNHPHVTRILTTPYSNGGLPGSAIKAADILLRKPFSVEALHAALTPVDRSHPEWHQFQQSISSKRDIYGEDDD